MRAIQQTEFGGPEVLRLTDVDPPEPGPDEVVITVTRAGVNFADLHARENSYLQKRDLPFIPGAEVAGTLASGQRVVAFCGTGGYAEQVVVSRSSVFEVPPGISDETALALLVQGVSAFHLIKTVAPVRPGDSVAVFSGAGGTGSLLIALARESGAGRIIATASSEEKREHCLALGADTAIDGAVDDLAERLIAANAGRPLDVIFEPVGGAVFEQAFAALAPFGRLAVYGISSGEPNEVRTSRLLRGSKTVAGFWLEHCRERPEMIALALDYLFARVAAGELEAQIGGVYDLADAGRAHEDLAARRTTGKLVLTVSPG